MKIKIAIRTHSNLNVREHWAKRARRAKDERYAGYLWTHKALRGIQFPATIRLTRIAPRALDGDNLQGALKHVRDGVADRIGVDDRDPTVTWLYDQRRGEPHEYAVLVEVVE